MTDDNFADRARQAQQLDAIAAALQTLTSKDFKDYTGSFLLLQIIGPSGKPLCAEFAIDGADMEKIKPAIIESLKSTLNIKRILLKMDLATIDKLVPENVPKKIDPTLQYDANYGDDKTCKCGHSYYRHFDTFANMAHIGCKYCDCFYFKEADS